MSHLPQLRSSLVRAAARQRQTTLADGHREDDLPSSRSRKVRDWSKASLQAVPVLMAIVATLAIVVLALTNVRPSPRHSTGSPAVSGRRQLINIIGVLRRPQSKADLSPPVLSQLATGPGLEAALRGTPDLALVRFATVTAWGEKLFFVPMKPPTPKALATLERQRPPFPSSLIRRISRRGETLGVYSRGGGGGGATAADIEAGYSLGTEGAGRTFAGGSTHTRLILVVPDGVAKVVFILPRQSTGAGYGTPVYKRALQFAAAVHGNVAAVQVDRQCCTERQPMIWYAADGRVIKRIGNFSTVNRIITPPKPGPETALSRAAERNPSTPNRVWVTPSIGGPHTNFMLHFRVLLTDADYSYRLSGTRCPAITVNGGDGGGSMDLRGKTWSDVVDAVQGQTWCPGTYHLSATVMDLGRYGALKHQAKPFGTATFTVRP